MEEKIDSLTMEVEAANAYINALHREKANLSETVIRAESINESLVRAEDLLNRELIAEKTKNRKLSKELEQKETEHQILQSEIKDASSDITLLQRVSRNLSETLKRREDDRLILIEKSKEADSIIAHLTDEKGQLKSELTVLEVKHSSLLLELQEAVRGINVLHGAKVELRLAQDNLDVYAIKLKEEMLKTARLEDERERLLQKLQTHLETINHLENTCRSLTTDRTNANNEVSELQAQKDELSEKLKTTHDERSDLFKKLIAEEGKTAHLTLEKGHMAGELQQIAVLTQTLQREKDGLTRTLHEKLIEVENAEIEVDALQKQNDALSERLKRAEDTIHSHEERTHAAQMELREAQSVITRLDPKAADVDSRPTILSADITGGRGVTVSFEAPSIPGSVQYYELKAYVAVSSSRLEVNQCKASFEIDYVKTYRFTVAAVDSTGAIWESHLSMPLSIDARPVRLCLLSTNAPGDEWKMNSYRADGELHQGQ